MAGHAPATPRCRFGKQWSQTMKVGYIGLGIMGRPCVSNLLRAGFDVTVWARRPESATSLIDAGAHWAPSVAELAAEVDVLITNVSDTADVAALLLGEGGVASAARAGLICIDMSTISPIGARDIAANLAARGISFLDCPVSGGEVGAINGTLTIMVGGDAAALDKVRPVLAAMGKTITHIGASGAGQVAKACNQIAVGVGIAAVAEVMKLAQACGVDPAPVRQALLGGFAGSNVLDTARELGIRLPEAERVAGLISQLVANGEGELDSSAIARLIWADNA